jgi:hypothetical protein
MSQSTAALPTELNVLLTRGGLAGRQLAAVETRLGFDGAGGTTLEAAASRFGYTRERVRQLEARVRALGPGGLHLVPSLGPALDLVERAAPDDRRHVARLLGGEDPFDPAGVLSAARVLGIRTTAVVSGSVVTTRNVAEPATLLLRTAAALAAPTGQVDVRRLARCTGLEPERIRRLLAETATVRWLGDGRSSLSVQTTRLERRVATVAQKVLAVARSLPLAELDDALRRTFVPVVVPLRALEAICDSLPWLHRDARSSRLTTFDRLDRRRVLSSVEQRLVQIFESAGPVLSFREAAELGQAEGLNRSTIGVFLPRTPVLKQLGRGRYGLRGHVAVTS